MDAVFRLCNRQNREAGLQDQNTVISVILWQIHCTFVIQLFINLGTSIPNFNLYQYEIDAMEASPDLLIHRCPSKDLW